MKKTILILVGIIVVAVIGVCVFVVQRASKDAAPSVPVGTTTSSQATTTQNKPALNLNVEIVAQNLNIPWDIAFLPQGEMLVTERPGNLLHFKSDGSMERIAVPNVKTAAESGLLGITLHPRFSENHFIYLYTTQAAGAGLINSVERYVYNEGKLSDRKTIIKNIPGALYHDGGRMEFGPDGLLYITTGDATNEPLAQNKNSLAGKILRVTDDGSIPEGNPFKTVVYSYGHRNPQGLAWDSAGRLWSTEHGRSGALSGYDEINLITAGANYGWPTIEGDKTREGMETPVYQSGSSDTWAPASAVIVGNSLFFGGLRGEALFEATLQGDSVVSLEKHFLKEYGRIRTVRMGPDGLLYITTSNKDGRGTGNTGDDKLLRVNPVRFK